MENFWFHVVSAVYYSGVMNLIEGPILSLFPTLVWAPECSTEQLRPTWRRPCPADVASSWRKRNVSVKWSLAAEDASAGSMPQWWVHGHVVSSRTQTAWEEEHEDETESLLVIKHVRLSDWSSFKLDCFQFRDKNMFFFMKSKLTKINSFVNLHQLPAGGAAAEDDSSRDAS